MLGNADVWATIAVKDLAAAKDYYTNTLGLSVKEENPYVVLLNSGSSVVEIYLSEFAGSGKATTATWEVDDIDGAVSDLKAKGTTFEHYDLPGTTLEGDVHVMEGEKAAWFKDPDGNILCVHAKA